MEINLLSGILIGVTSIFGIITFIFAFKLGTLSKKAGNVADLDQQLLAKKNEIKHLLDLEGKEAQLKQTVRDLSEEAESLNEISDELKSTERDLSIFLPQLDLINLGFFEEPEYLFDTSDAFKAEIKALRETQKELIKYNNAITLPESIAITDNDSLAKKALKGQSELMLKAFNLETDKLIAGVKPGNFPQTLERINKLATSVEKSSLSFACGFSNEYIELKYKEVELAFQYALKKQREKEEQDRIKEQMREEEKARREYERAIEKAQREEEIYQDALENAKKELELAGDQEKDELAKKIEALQTQLQEAHEKNQRAKSLAEQTKKGHVYVISNLGSFGENIYKIGLTRRLDPMDRVKELGDASVPFTFDVHAMIHSDDAPALERDLHNRFTLQRVNQVNQKKEFFNVSLENIKDGVEELTGGEAEFTMTALAMEFHESLALRNTESD